MLLINLVYYQSHFLDRRCAFVNTVHQFPETKMLCLAMQSSLLAAKSVTQPILTNCVSFMQLNPARLILVCG